MMGANLVGFVLGVDAERYFSSAALRVRRRVLIEPLLIETRMQGFDSCLVLLRACSSAYSSCSSTAKGVMLCDMVTSTADWAFFD
jgi:hypothetical protein